MGHGALRNASSLAKCTPFFLFLTRLFLDGEKYAHIPIPRNLCVLCVVKQERVTEVTSYVVNVLRKAVTGGQVVTFFVFQFGGVQVFFK